MADDFDMNDPDNIEGMAHVKALLKHIGDDPEREGLEETPKRVLKAFGEYFSGYQEDP
ncbi:MAG: GTP cyclohydrolase I, partial [Ghiorsea sp.]